MIGRPVCCGVRVILPVSTRCCLTDVWTSFGAVSGSSSQVPTPVLMSGVRRTRGRPYGFRFRPGVGPSVIGHAAHALTDVRIPAADLWPSYRVDQWTEQLCGGDDPAAALAMLCTETAYRPHRWRLPRRCSAMAVLWRTLPTDSASPPGLCTDYHCSTSGMDPRHSPGSCACNAPSPCCPAPIPSTVSHAVGYADYAHMFRDLTELTGRSPVTFTADQASAQ